MSVAVITGVEAVMVTGAGAGSCSRVSLRAAVDMSAVVYMRTSAHTNRNMLLEV